MNEGLSRWGATTSLAVIVGLAVILALSPHFGPVSGIIGLLAAVAVAVGVAKRYPTVSRR